MSDITFLTLQQEVVSMCKMSLSNDAELAMIKRWINFAQEDINSEDNWPWLEGREIVQTVTEKTAGTVAIAVGGTAITGTDTAFASTDVGSFIQFSTNDDWYKITAVASAVSATIEKPFTGTSAATEDTYTIRKVYYTLSSNVDTVLNLKQTITPIKLEVKHWREADMYQPNITDTGDPTTCTMFGMDSSNNWQFFLSPIPDAIINLEFRIKKRTTDLSADTDVTVIPSKWAKSVLLAGAIWRGMEYNRINKEDIRADKWIAMYNRGIAKMKTNSDVCEDHHTRLKSCESSIPQPGMAFPDEIDA